MRLQIGYVPLCDAAPVLMARELGFAREEGLDLDLSAEPSWATLRDRLALGHLDGAHMLAPLALASALGLSGPPSDLIVPLPLSLNGNALTLSNALWAAMAEEATPGEGWRGTARAFARLAAERRRAGRPVTTATARTCSARSTRTCGASGCMWACSGSSTIGARVPSKSSPTTRSEAARTTAAYCCSPATELKSMRPSSQPRRPVVEAGGQL